MAGRRNQAGGNSQSSLIPRLEKSRSKGCSMWVEAVVDGFGNAKAGLAGYPFSDYLFDHSLIIDVTDGANESLETEEAMSAKRDKASCVLRHEWKVRMVDLTRTLAM